MPIPYDAECADAMVYVSSSRSAIRTALQKVADLANDDTWSGDPADRWMQDLRGHVTDALNALGDPLDTAMQECRHHAHQLQVQSAQRAAAASAGS
jgi:hypothetical protein